MSIFSDRIKQRATMLSEMVLDEDIDYVSDSDTPYPPLKPQNRKLQ